MINQIKQLGKDSFIYGMGDGLKRAIGFLLLPVYTRFLSPGDYGQLELLMVMSTMILIVTSQGMSTAFFRFYGFSDNDTRRSELINTSFYYLLFSALISCALFFVFANQFAILLSEQDTTFTLFVKIIALTAFFQISSIVPFQIYRAKLQTIKYVTVSIVGFLVQVTLNIFFVASLKMGVKGVLLGNATSASFVFMLNLFLTRNTLTFNFSFSALKDMLKFGMPLIFVGIFNWILQVSDRILLQKLATTDQVGLYSLGFRFAGILTILAIAPFSMAWGAYCFQIATTDKAKETFKVIATYWFFALSFLGLGVLLFSPPVIKLMAAEPFWTASQVVLPLVFMTVVSGMYTIFDLGINIAKKTHYMTFIVGLGAALNVILNILLIPKYGMMGAAFASFFSFLLIMLITYNLSQKLYFIPFEKIRFYKISFVFVFISFVSYLVNLSNVYYDFLVRIALFLAFPLGIYFIGFFNSSEKDAIKFVRKNLSEKRGWRSKFQYGFSLMQTPK